MDLEKELTCSICTDILYQPLTLLDCLHTFCGSCLQEWFAWQAQSAAQSQQSHPRRTAHPYTCPSCRESVRGTKGGWMLSTMLEAYLKAHPEKAKSDVDKEDMAKRYKPGDEVLLPVEGQVGGEGEDGEDEDERVMRSVREMSLAEVGDPEAARRRRAEREARHRRRREEGGGRRSPEEQGRRQQPSRWASQQAQLTEARLRQHDPHSGEAQIEHQPSLRSLLSASEADPQDVQAEILQSIYQEGMLEGIDLDNLTTQQEEELTERIADAYRRRQRERRRERSRNREQRAGSERSPRPTTGGSERSPPQTEDPASQEAQQARPRPPIARPHLFEQSLEPGRGHARSQSNSSQRDNRSTGRTENRSTGSPASRSATDLSLQPSSDNTQRMQRRRLSSTGRSVTDPQDVVSSEHLHRMRARSNETRTQQADGTRPATHASRTPRSTNNSTSSLPIPSQPTTQPSAPTSAPAPIVSSPPTSPPANSSTFTEHAVRPAESRAAFAPEAVLEPNVPSTAPAILTINCNRCAKPSIQHNLHYHCPICVSDTPGGSGDGAPGFNLCLPCYRSGQGCKHWFGFGFRAWDRFYRSAPPEGQYGAPPHVLIPRKYTKTESTITNSPIHPELQEGAFCDTCFFPANDGYYYCNICLEGAWGYCSTCIRRGLHCSHPLLPIQHISHSSQSDPAKVAFVGLPHLRQDSYVPLPVLTDCDVCGRGIAPSSTGMHCYECNEGDYDVCNECYRGLVAQGKVSTANGPNGWRRCLQGHRMVVLGYQDTMDGGHLRILVRDRVGGTAFREDEISMSGREPPRNEAYSGNPYPPDGGVGTRCLALYSYWPAEGVSDELAFPKNAEIREVEEANGDWFWGVYAGRGGLFPSNHVRRLG